MMRAPIIPLVLLSLAACNYDSPTAPGPPNDAGAASGFATFTGRTVDPNGVPLPNTRLGIGAAATGRVAYTTTSDANARFEFQRIPPGLYTLFFNVDSPEPSSGGNIRLLAGLNTHDVHVSNCIVPYGTVRDAGTGAPIAGAKVTIFGRETATDAGGHYQIDFGCNFVQGSTIVMRAEHPQYEPSETLTRASFLCTCRFDFNLKHR